MLGSQKVKFCLLLPLFRIAFERGEKRDLQKKRFMMKNFTGLFFYPLATSGSWKKKSYYVKQSRGIVLLDFNISDLGHL